MRAHTLRSPHYSAALEPVRGKCPGRADFEWSRTDSGEQASVTQLSLPVCLSLSAGVTAPDWARQGAEEGRVPPQLERAGGEREREWHERGREREKQFS